MDSSHEALMHEAQAEAMRLRAELEQSRETNRRLNRRCQALESEDSKDLRHLGGASKCVWKFLHHLQENYRGSRNALNRIGSRAQEMMEPEWLLIQRLEKEREQFGEFIFRQEKRVRDACADFEAAKAYVRELEALVNRLKAEKVVANAE